MSDISIEVVEELEIINLTVDETEEIAIIEVNIGQKGDPGAFGVPAGGTTGQLLAKLTDNDQDAGWIDPPITSGTANRAAWFGSNGLLASRNDHIISDDGFDQLYYYGEPDGLNQNTSMVRHEIFIEPIQDSPGESFLHTERLVRIDPDSSGFEIGTGGTGFRFVINNLIHEGTSDLGAIEFIQNNFTIGNGTDPIEVNGLGYMFGFGNIRSGVTMVGPIQGYGFQPQMEAGSVMDSSTYIQAFYDNATIHADCYGYTSYNAGPTIDTMKSTHNYNGFSVQPTIDLVESNAGVIGVSVGANIDVMAVNSYYQGVNVNPNINSARYAAGLNVSMDNVTPYAGVAASIVIQDLTLAIDTPTQDGNAATIEFRNDGTAGAETVSNSGQLVFIVHMQSGVSTATQIAAALNGYANFTSIANVTISGVGGNAQVTQAATNFAGGENPGRVLAAWLDGDVEITGSLSFQGSLSIGALSAFASKELEDTGGNPQSIHTLITAPTIAANTTLTTGDLLGINTAMLLTMGANSHLTTALTGAAALGLPAVVSMGAGSTADQISGALFAVSLDGGAGGGTITNMDLCRTLAIPNGITTVTNLRGYKFDLPFGDPGTTSWGFYESPGVHNFFAGDLKIGSGGDIADAGFKLHVEGGGFLLEDAITLISASGSEIGFFAATPVVQQASSGAVAAGALYTATEQTMIQEMYNALRAYGLLT